MLTESTLYQQIYNTDTTITIHRFNIWLKDGVEISRSSPHTKTLTPIDDYSQEDADTKRMCKALWSNKVIEDYTQLINNVD